MRRVGALKLPVRPEIFFIISSLFSFPGINSKIFLPLATIISGASTTVSHTRSSAIVSLVAFTSSSISILFSEKTVQAFLQETQPFLIYAQSIFTLILQLKMGKRTSRLLLGRKYHRNSIKKIPVLHVLWGAIELVG